MKYSIFSDVDNTLLPHYEEDITEEIKKSLIELREKNIGFSVATGRTLQDIAFILDYIHEDLPVIVNDGAKIYSKKQKNISFNHYLKKKITNSFIELSKEMSSVVLFLK